MGSLSKIKLFLKQHYGAVFDLLRGGFLSVGIFLVGIGVLLVGIVLVSSRYSY